ncbi:MAG: hypothetical protein ACYCX2_08615 [Christensenellales bacterium]
MRDLRESKNNKSQQGRQEPRQEQKKAPQQEQNANRASQNNNARQKAPQSGYGSGQSRNAEELKRTQQQAGKNISENQLKHMQELQKKADQYKGKGEKEMMDEITRLARQEKAKGSLNNEQLERFASTVRPMLDNTQQQKLKQILDSLK